MSDSLVSLSSYRIARSAALELGAPLLWFRRGDEQSNPRAGQSKGLLLGDPSGGYRRGAVDGYSSPGPSVLRFPALLNRPAADYHRKDSRSPLLARALEAER